MIAARVVASLALAIPLTTTALAQATPPHTARARVERDVPRRQAEIALPQ